MSRGRFYWMSRGRFYCLNKIYWDAFRCIPFFIFIETVSENNETKHKLDYEYDLYGNVILEKRYTGENNWNDFISIGYSYEDLSDNINRINGANLSRIYVVPFGGVKILVLFD